MDTVQKFLTTPLKIGDKVLPTRLILAPMVGLTHLALRKLIQEYGGCGLLFTEMCSARAIPSENPRNSPYFKFLPEELPFLTCQIVGNNPQEMLAAAKRIEELGFFGVDLNFGCSVANIYKKQSGAYLLEEPLLASKIISLLKKHLTIPLSVKFRLPQEASTAKVKELAQSFEQSGADFLIFHPRKFPDRRNRPPRWEYIEVVQASVSIPVFGNGNVFNPKDLKNILKTGCAGVALGRIAAARPFIFAELCHNFTPTKKTYLEVAQKMLTYLQNFFEPVRALRLFYKWATYFCANFDFGLSLYSQLKKANSLEEIEKILPHILTLNPLTSPNLLLLGN